jgi:hypothetical protein
VYLQLRRIIGEFAQWSGNDYGCHSCIPLIRQLAENWDLFIGY